MKRLTACLITALTLSTGVQAQNTNFNITEQKALDFLYQNMPLPDSADYSKSFYKNQIRASLKARREMPWGMSVPEREWMHFVLPIRVNNENLDNSREVIYEALKERLKGMTMEQAALEANHWCHEHVSYKPSDARTSSPLCTMWSAIGRCGEESTYTVAAMRAVGIPARQVYTPRWAHTDDNHAWVEVWIDGQWKFLGACEPEPVLNLGWFNAPASRAMLMHTKAFGQYTGPERVMSQTACYTEIDVTDNYAPTSVIKVQTVNEQGMPIKAQVQFRLYNYAEFYNLLTTSTDEQGHADFKAGHGDLLVWATDGKKFGFEKVSVGKQESVRIVLKHQAEELNMQHFDLDVTPPNERNTIPAMTDEQIALNKERLAQEDSIRNAYVSTFFTQETAKEWLTYNLLTEEISDTKLADILVKSRGNHKAITTFLKESKDKQKAYRLLSYISEKDLRDIPLDVLRDHYKHSLSTSAYILNPRINTEQLTAYRASMQKFFSKAEKDSFKKNPELLARWCEEHITTDATRNPQVLCMHPMNVSKVRRCDPLSRSIFFVAMARSLEIEARIDEVTGKTQWRKNGEWMTVLEERNANSSRQGTLHLSYKSDGVLTDPHYNNHFTICKLENGAPILMNYPECEPMSKIFSRAVAMDEGSYVLTTGTRLAKGGVLSQMTFFNVKAGQQTDLCFSMRANTDEVTVLGNFGSETRYTPVLSESDKTSIASETSILSTTGRGYYVIGMLSVGTEPTNHAMEDLSAARQQLEAWGRPILLICKDAEEVKKVKSAFPYLPSTIHFGIDNTGKIAEGMATAVQGETASSLPIFLIADTFDRVVFMRQGYTIGLGDQLVKIAAKL